MEIIPAIDLLDGRCVRLIQGRYDRVLSYERDPLDVARSFQDAGAQTLHVIDLNGARAGAPTNLEAIRRLSSLGIRIQFGGGVRDEATIRAALDAGAERVIVGTRALEEPGWFRGMALNSAYAKRLCIGLDARLGKLATHGWTRETEQRAVEVVEGVADLPLAAVVYTDIGRDGTLLGPNLDAIRDLASFSRLPIIASGGVTDIDDIRRLSQLKLAGVVIGRAIYEGAIDLKAAIAASRG